MSVPARGRFEALTDVVSLLATVKEPEDDRVWSRVMEKLAAALDCEAASYFVYVPKGDRLSARAALGPVDAKPETRSIPVGSGLCGWVAKYREPAVVDDAGADSRFLDAVDAATGYRTRSVLAVPLFDRLELTGVLELINKRSGLFDAADLALAQAAAQAASLTLRALRLESTVDRVTAHNASILENLGGGFLAVDVHGRLMLCNPAAKRLLGLPEDLPLGQPLQQSLSVIPELADILTDTLLKKETVKRQDLWWKRGAETRVLGYSTLLIQDPRGQMVGAGITFQDITQFQKSR